MELGQYTIQIFVGLVVILGAAFVALICDFLKGNNEQLRELTIELKVRREEEQRRSQMMFAQTVPASAPALRERMRMEHVEKTRIEERAEVTAPRALATPSRTAAKEAAKNNKRAPSAEALAAMERGAQLASAPRRRPMPPPRESEVVAAPAAGFEYAQPIEYAQPVEVISPKVEVVAKAEVVATPVEVKIEDSFVTPKVTLVAHNTGKVAGKKDWGSILARKPKMMEQNQTPAVQVREDLLDAVVAATASTNAQSVAGAAVPAGFHEGYILSRLVQSRQPVSGLVVSIGVNTPRNQDGSMPESVRQLMQSLIGPGDFACQSSSEEYLLIYPNERGASAQRRLSEIAQQLWDFQLRSMGSFSILFSWGGIEVRSESIDEAIASANERMQETRRGRKLLTMEARPEQHQQALRQAV